jgi:hypothetical protein
MIPAVSGADDARRWPLPRRRIILGAAGLAATGALAAGCSSSRGAAANASDGADTRAADRNAQRAAALWGLAASWGPVDPYPRLSADHRAHLAALGQAATTPSPVPGRPTPTRHMAAEREGVTEALADVAPASPGAAVLLTRIAAVRAVHADLLAAANRLTVPAVSPTPSSGASLDPAGRAGLAALIRGEHAAVFGYGVITAAVPDAERTRVRGIWTDHQVRRDRYGAALLAAGGLVPAALPAYDVGTVGAATAAAALARTIEAALFTTALNALAQLEGEWRSAIAADAVQTARRLERWGGRVPALPGG